MPDLCNKDYWLRELGPIFVGEILGTATLMFIGCFGSHPRMPNNFTAAMGWGLAVLTAIQICGHISGAHLNPSVTIAAAIMRVVRWSTVPVYILAQFIGALLGFALLFAVFLEVLLTGTLVFILCVVWDKRSEDLQQTTSLRVSFALAGVFMAGGPLTGASLNTPRSVAPAIIFTDNLNLTHWVYWVGPNVGAAIVSFLYRVLAIKMGNSGVIRHTEEDADLA